MSIKKILLLVLAGFFIIAVFPMQLNAMKPTNTVLPGDSAASVLRAKQIIQRVNAIREIDKNDLTITERNELKKELLGMKKEIDADKVVYISVGLIVIVLLLALLVIL